MVKRAINGRIRAEREDGKINVLVMKLLLAKRVIK